MPIDPLYLNPGDLRHKITIQAENTAERDAAGQPVSTWTTILTTRAKIEDSGGSSYKMAFQNNAEAAQSTDLITIRWPGSSIVIEPGQQIIFGTSTYLIQAVDNVLHRNRKIRLATLMIDENSN